MLNSGADGHASTTETQEIGIARTTETPVVPIRDSQARSISLETPDTPELQSGVRRHTLPENVSPLREYDHEGWWDATSPLNVAVRRRQFLRPEFGRSITAENYNEKESFPQRNRDRASAASLHTLDSLEILGEHRADFNPHEGNEGYGEKRPASADAGRPLSDRPDTPSPKTEEKNPYTAAFAGGVPPKTPSVSFGVPSSKNPAPFIFPHVSVEDPRRKISNKNLICQRSLIAFIILGINIGCLVGALLCERHLWVLIVILVAKAKDVLSTLIQVAWLPVELYRKRKDKPDVPRMWIMACITAYAENEEQVMRTINSVVDNAPDQHNLAIVIVLDGKPQTIVKHFSNVVQTVRRPYQTWRFAHNEVNIYTGLYKGIPVTMMEKIGNAGKKDSLILCHDLFNHMRANAPEPTKILRSEIWNILLPKIIPADFPQKFDLLFFTDADSLVHAGTLATLAEALIREPDSIGACGLVLAEMINDNGWSLWFLYQQFQYIYGQFIRRRAESIWGRVTCLPGCVTMIKNRPEMAGAIELYARPVTNKTVFKHQVQYLGTDRRLTWSMLEQSKHLKTLFVPRATSQTVAPQNFLHYMSQRRRWGSNAYFNDLFYIFGRKSWLVTRLWGLIDIVRQTLVYYRLANTILFIYGLSRHFTIIALVPFLVVTQIPTIWFVIVVLFRERLLRRMAHKLLVGWLINKLISPIFSILIFSRIILNLGNAVWGRTGASTQAASALDILHTLTPKRTWTPTRITTLVRDTIRERTKQTNLRPAVVVPVDNHEEPAPGPQTQSIGEKQGTTSYSPTMPTPPKTAHIPADDSLARYGTVRRLRTVRIDPEVEMR